MRYKGWDEYGNEFEYPEGFRPMVCMVCHADLTPYLDEAEEDPEQGYGIWCRECGSFVVPLYLDDLPY